MAQKLYRYKQLSTNIDGKHYKSWHKPITLVRKVGNLTCEGCFFSTTPSKCSIMLRSKQLPPCYSSNYKRQYIFVKLLTQKKHKQ